MATHKEKSAESSNISSGKKEENVKLYALLLYKVSFGGKIKQNPTAIHAFGKNKEPTWKEIEDVLQVECDKLKRPNYKNIFYSTIICMNKSREVAPNMQVIIQYNIKYNNKKSLWIISPI